MKLKVVLQLETSDLRSNYAEGKSFDANTSCLGEAKSVWTKLDSAVHSNSDAIKNPNNNKKLFYQGQSRSEANLIIVNYDSNDVMTLWS